MIKSESETLSALASYCSQAERCLFDIRKKMQAANLSKEEERRITDKLLAEKFIDEKRFSRSFVHDKYKLNQWGRIKIRYELKERGIRSEDYEEALEAIDEDEYSTILADILKNKKRTLKGNSSQELFQKLYRFASARGYEAALIIKTLKTMLKNIDDD